MIKAISLVLSATVCSSSFCFMSEKIPDNAVRITEAEYEFIEGELENGRTTMEIAEVLTYYTPASITSYSGITWVKKSGKWYCRDKSGSNITGFARIGKTVYYMNDKGIMMTGWQQIDGIWYYFASSGAMKTGWQKISKKWYYFNSNGEMQTGLQSIGDEYYLFADSGAMQTGWKQYQDQWYYLTSSGAAKTDIWYKSGGIWYYFGSDAAMATGLTYIEGANYFFEDNGEMATGWQNWNGEWYYMGSNGAALCGWRTIGSHMYFFDEDGKMLHDTEVGGIKLDSEGHVIENDEPEEEPVIEPHHEFKTAKEDECVKLINEARKARAVEKEREWYVPLKLTDSNRKRAHIRCDEIVKSFSHNSPSGNADWHENIHKGGGAPSAKTIVNAWLKSGSHKANLMYGVTADNNETLYCGIGILETDEYTYCVFGISGGVKGTPTTPSGYVDPALPPDPEDNG